MRPAIERALARMVKQDDGCWIFMGARSCGYGVVGAGARGTGLAYTHRLSYEHFVRPIPAGLHIDHLCRNRACMNPAHLEPVTQAENNLRAKRANPATACRRGHPYTAETPHDGKQHICPTCLSIRNAARRQEAVAS